MEVTFKEKNPKCASRTPQKGFMLWREFFYIGINLRKKEKGYGSKNF